MMKVSQDLIDISRFYGLDKRYVIAEGGSISFKTKEHIWVNASGSALATINEDDFSVLDRKKLNLISTKSYSVNATKREEELKNDLADANLTKNKPPLVETFAHNIIEYTFVVHLHPTLVNGLMCSQNVEEELFKLFGEKNIYIPYTDPGYGFFQKVEKQINIYQNKYKEDPKVIWLQNHGVFVAADTITEIKNIYKNIFDVLEKNIKYALPETEREVCKCTVEILPALRMMLSLDNLKTLRLRKNELIKYYYDDIENQKSIAIPFTPDAIVYCKSNYIFLNEEEPEKILEEAHQKIKTFIVDNRYAPKVLLVKGIGLVAVGDNAKQCDIILDVFEDAMKIAYLAKSFGGEHSMTQQQIDFIDNYEVKNCCRSVFSQNSVGRAKNKTIIITGAAQGFGEGIARILTKEGANIIVADLNSEMGEKTVAELNSIAKNNQVIFVKTDVGDVVSIENLMLQTVIAFGGIDTFISNAGVLRAGGLDDLSIEDFNFVTKVNYNAYFYCTKVVSKVMKLQTQYASSDYYADIIQINSKSGLRGSKANFAYAGGKFGGIGLTQSFALELASYNIKVNSICPGNYFDGPLWSNPENGLFVQYLRAGKVPGAKSINDVREHYLAQIPMRKACSPVDVTKAVLYVMEQCGETGQAIPVTGGQVMLN